LDVFAHICIQLEILGVLLLQLSLLLEPIVPIQEVGVADGSFTVLLRLGQLARLGQLVARRRGSLNRLARLVLVKTSSFLKRVASTSPVHIALPIKEIAGGPARRFRVDWLVLVILQVFLQFGNDSYELLALDLLGIKVVRFSYIQVTHNIIDRVMQ